MYSVALRVYIIVTSALLNGTEIILYSDSDSYQDYQVYQLM